MSPSTFTITYSKPGTVPPVFVAGSFSSPPWQPQQLEQEGDEGSGTFSKVFVVKPGTYQYKFRLGTGDWWVLDEEQDTATDEQGNVNNVLVIQDSQQVSASPLIASAQGQTPVENHMAQSDEQDALPNTEELELPPAVPVSEISVQAADSPVSSLMQAIPAAAAAAAGKVTPVRSVSHDLPTPPISEEGDDIESKEVPTESAERFSQHPRHISQASQSSKREVSSGVPSSGWSRNSIIVLALALALGPLLAWSLSR